MELKVKRNSLLEKTALICILFHGLFARFTELESFSYKIIIIFFLVCIVKNYNKLLDYLKCRKKVLVILILCICAVIVNVANHGFQTYTYSNLIILFYNTAAMILLDFLIFCMEYNIKQILLSYAGIINIIWIVNLIVLCIQLNGTGFLIKDSWLKINSYYLDQCCGLFGNSGTHELAFFSIFVFVYNMCYASNCNKRKQSFFICYTIFTCLMMYILSTLNDNKAFLFLFPIVVVLYIFLKVSWGEKNYLSRVKKILLVATVTFIISLILIQIPMINDKVNSVLISISKIINVDYTSAIGGSERLAIFIYALMHGNGWSTGVGLGAYSWTQGKVAYFSYFGLSSIGACTLLGGIWFYILMSLLHKEVACCFRSSIKISRIGNIGIWVLIIVASIYSNIFTSLTSTIWILLSFVIVFVSMPNYKDLKKRGV